MGNSYRAALITGSTSGIGAAFIEKLPAETSLLLTGRNSTALAKLKEALTSSGRRVDVVTADLAVSAGRDAVIEVARRASIDLLICNAGLGFSGQFPTTSIEAERQTAEVNIVATIELLHALIPSMLAAARSHSHRAGIIVVSSRAAFGPCPNLATYGASKAFQLRLVETIAVELKNEPVDILAICPTYTKTDFFSRAGAEPPPSWAVSPGTVAQEAMDNLGKKNVYLCYAPEELPNPIIRTLRFARQVAKRTLQAATDFR
jgi:short-subunit dehydrogenase